MAASGDFLTEQLVRKNCKEADGVMFEVLFAHFVERLRKTVIPTARMAGVVIEILDRSVQL